MGGATADALTQVGCKRQVISGDSPRFAAGETTAEHVQLGSRSIMLVSPSRRSDSLTEQIKLVLPVGEAGQMFSFRQ